MRQKITIRFDEKRGPHVDLTVFMNGANCGSLTMRGNEARDFSLYLFGGRETFNYEYKDNYVEFTERLRHEV